MQDPDIDRDEFEQRRETAVPAQVIPPATRFFRNAWNPEPVDPPEIDPDLPNLTWPQRCAEAFRFAALSAERWLSRQGILREWLRLNLWIGTALLALALLVIPPVTLLLQGAAKWSALLQAISLNVTTTIASLPPLVIALATAFIAFKLLRRNWLRHRAQRRYKDQGSAYGMH